MTNYKEKTTTSKLNTKALLFAGLLAIMILPLSNMDMAFAANPEDVKDLAEHGAKLAEKIAKLTEEFEAITLVLNEHGMYTEEQFEKEKTKEITHLNRKYQT
ncbi:hypothetical protein [Nitrosopumilus sp.]|uniref:hypothetical protein n=1 Tax=Nitrosopumilus sp. TaxID=2024843 RepID=UPI002931BE41|nr:hypothetical protein [Nitrosopumilus sp.]